MRKKTSKSEKKGGIVLDIEQSQSKIKAFNTIVFVVVVVVALFSVLPILWVVASAFKDTKEFLMDPPTIIPRSFQLWKLGKVWQEAKFGQAYFNTLCMGLGNVVFSITINGLAGFVLSRLKPKGHILILTLILWTMMMPHSMNMVPNFMTFVDFPVLHVNLTNTFLPFWLMSGAGTFYLMMFKSFFDGIPSSYLEAARLDGCSELGIYGRIILPLSKPVVFTITIFVLNGIWGDFLWPYLILTDPKLYTTGIKIYHLQTQLSIDEQYVSMLFVIIPSVVMYLCFQKYLSQGIAIGGVKG